MLSQQQLTDYLRTFLAVDSISDYCPNGLQVAGRQDINVLVSGVTASLALIEKAIEYKACALLVHHGYFWKGENPCVVGIKQKRLQQLLAHDINLYAYHLPLDKHQTLGNNVQLAKKLDIDLCGSFEAGGEKGLACWGVLNEPMSPHAFERHLEKKLQHQPLHIPGKSENIERIGFCTGAAQGFISDAAQHQFDAYLSGEVSEQTFHIAQETGIHYYAAGHHATERYGVQALGEHLAHEFGVAHHFIDIPNPV